MNNMKFYPFERNNFYSGRLMTAECFQSEQRYGNDKRRFANRFTAGYGVVCGLDTIALSDGRISVEAGAAIDGAGREIVVSGPDVKKLSSLKGYDRHKENGEYFLYIEYAERSVREPEIFRGNDGLSVFDKTDEGYDLYLAQSPVKTCRSGFGNLSEYYRHDEELFKNDEAEIRLIAPKFIKSNENFFAELKIFPRYEAAEIYFRCTIALKCARWKGKDRIEAEFDSRTRRAENGEYSVRFLCAALSVSRDIAEISVSKESMNVKCGNTFYSGANDVLLESVLSDSDPSESVCESYRSQLMNRINHRTSADICLARIVLENGAITKIYGFPLGHILKTAPELALENEALKDKIRIMESSVSKRETENKLPASDSSYEISSGEVVLNLGIGGKAGKRFFSDDISHGLGIGNVMVFAGLKENDSEECFVYGSSEIFDEKNAGIKAELAARTDASSGTFKIGLRLLEATAEYSASVHWTAVKRREISPSAGERKIIIECAVKTLGIMESAYFTVKFINSPETDILWSVESENGGTIDDNGRYTAPNRSGVFKISAVCADDSTIRAAAYIVVKNLFA